MLVERVTRPWVDREDERGGALGDPGDDRAKRLRLRVRLPVDRQHDVRRLVQPRALARDRQKDACGVGHDVADDLAATADAFRLELLGRALVGAEEEGRKLIDLHAVQLLRHREVEAAQARLDVRDRHSPAACAPARVVFVSP